MAKRPFMEMDLDEFEEKKDEGVIDEPSLDFDFDEDVDDVGTDDSSDESTDETTTDTTETQDDTSGAENYEDKYIEELKKRKDQDPIQQLEIAVGAKLPKDFAEGVFIFDENKFTDSEIKKDGKVVFGVCEMFSVRSILSYRNKGNCGIEDESLLAIGSDGFGNFIVLRTTDWTYHVWYHDTNKTIMIAKAFDEEGVDPGYDISEEDTLLYLLKSGMTDDSSSNEQAELDESTNEPTEETSVDESETIQEGALTNGIGRIRNELAKALAGKYVVSNLNPKTDEFNIKEQGGDFNSPTTYCTPTNNGLKVVTRGVGIPMKPHFASIPLSQAFEKIKALFDKPELLTAESYVMESFGKTLASEWIKKPEVIKEINDTIDAKFKAFFPAGMNPTEADLAENRKKVLGLTNDPHLLMMTYAKKSFDAMLKEEQRIEEEKMRKEMEEMVAKIMGNRKTTQESAVTKFPYPSRFFQEAEEEESTDDEELEIPEIPDLGEDDIDTDDTGDDSGEVEVTAEVEEKITPEGEDLSSFGMDTSDVQNDFDQKDVDSLNKLIAAESEAINDYFDASKDTRNEDLRTLFSDIGHEERFHLEQLMYSKAKLTGEKYEPRDPKVKEEYEELINGGMDEDTAAYTAMDKASMLPDDDGDDSDMEELEQESALICNMLYNNELLVSICEHCVSNDTITRDKNVAMFVEGYIMESIDNVSSAPKEMTKIKSPFSILAKGLGVAIAGLAKMSSIARDSMRRSNLKRARRKEWIQKHGIAELFKGGISLYLYNDRTNSMDFNTPCRYVDFLYRLTKAIGETCGIQLTQAAKHKSVPDPIKFTSVKEGMYKLSQVVFTKTKVVVTDANKTALQNEFFGYNDNKLNVAVTHGTDQVVRDSANIYNRLDAMILIIKQYAEISKAVLDQLSKLEGDVNSVYYKNRPVYNKAKDNMTEVIKKYNQFISATSHDLNQIMKLDNGLLKMTRERDMTEQGGGKWEGPDIRVNPKTQPQDPKYTQMKKKKGLFH